MLELFGRVPLPKIYVFPGHILRRTFVHGFLLYLRKVLCLVFTVILLLVILILWLLDLVIFWRAFVLLILLIIIGLFLHFGLYLEAHIAPSQNGGNYNKRLII